MHRARGFAFLVTSLLVSAVSTGAPVGPDVSHTEVAASVTYDLSTYTYTYKYGVTSLPANTGAITSIVIDITTKLTTDLNIPDPVPGVPQVKQFLLQEFDENGVHVLPVHVTGVTNWAAVALTIQGMAGWVENNPRTDGLAPGQSVLGLTMRSKYVPGFRELRIRPDIFDWNLLPDVEDSDEVQAEKQAFIDSLDVTLYTLGPVGVFNYFDHWDHVRDSLNQAITLNWIPDAALANTLVSQLAAARTALDANDGVSAKALLETLIETATQATADQRRNEVRDLLVLNAQRLIEGVPSQPVSYEPLLSLTPARLTQALGEEAAIVAKVVNSADHNSPVPNQLLLFTVTEGPNAGAINNVAFTDSAGEATFNYVGTKIGRDTVLVRNRNTGEQAALSEAAKVTWSGGADLVVPYFFPPLLQVDAPRDITLSDTTKNIGSIPAVATTTRYYLSNTPPPFDFGSAILLGERFVAALDPNQEDEANGPSYSLPHDLPPGLYYFAACADAAQAVTEVDEENNCSYSELGAIKQVTIMPVRELTNSSPDCTAAVPGVGTLWPPNHKLMAVAIQGITDPDNDAVTIRIDAITQDEPVNAKGDGNTAPDGLGIGAARAQLRAERSGKGNGRVYRVAFTANNGNSGSCTGFVTIGVPHDQGGKTTPVDDGQNYDSTAGS